MSKLSPNQIDPRTDEGRRYFVNAAGTSTVIWHPHSPYPRNIYTTVESGGYWGMSFGGGQRLKGDVFTLYVPETVVFNEALVPPRALYESSTFLFNEDCIDDLNGVSYDDYVKFREDTYKLIPGKGLKKRGKKLSYGEIENPQPIKEGDVIVIVAASDHDGQKMAQCIKMGKRATVIPSFSEKMDSKNWMPVCPLDEVTTWFPETEEHLLQMYGTDYGLTQKELVPLPAYLEGKCIAAYEYVKKEVTEPVI